MKEMDPEERKKKEKEDRKSRNSRITWSYGLKGKTAPRKPKPKSAKLTHDELERKKAEWDRERFAKEVEDMVDKFTRDHEPMLGLDDELVEPKDKETPPWD